MMKLSKWLTISSRGATRMTSSKPRLNADEISMNLNIELPDALFEKPALVASITVPDEAAVSEVINSIVYDNVEEAIETATGLAFAISVANTTSVDNALHTESK